MRKIHPFILKLQKLEREALKKKYIFALKPLNEAINKIGWNLSKIIDERR